MSVATPLTQLLERLTRRRWGKDVELSYWDRGGPPGQGYESNLLQLFPEQQTTRLVYTKTRFDQVKPPYRTDKFQCEHPTQELTIFDDLATAGLFTRSFAEEKPPPIGDVTKLTITVSDGAMSMAKTFYKAMPVGLKHAQRTIEHLMNRCELEGARLK